MTLRRPAAWLIAAALLVPLWLLPGSYESFDLPKTVLLGTFAALAAAAWLVGEFGLEGRPLRLDARVWAWLALLAAFCLSYISSPWRAAEGEAFMRGLSWLLAGLIAALSIGSPAQSRGLAVAAALAAVAAAAWSLWQGPASASTFGNPAFLASYLAACGPLLLWLCAEQAGAAGAAWAAGAAVVAAALLLSGTRGAWAAALLSWPIALGAASRTVAAGRRWLKSAAVALALGAVAAGALGGAFIVHRAASAARTRAMSLQGRVLMWRVAWDMLRERPLLGQGPGGYYYRHLEHQARLLERPENKASLPYWSHTHCAHDAFLDLAAETGVLGLGAFLAVLACAGLAWARERGGPSLRDAWACAALALLADGLSGLPLQLPASALLFALALAAASYPRSDAGGEAASSRSRRARLAVSILASSALVALPARLWLRQAAELSIARAMRAVARMELPAAVAELRRAVVLAPDSGKAQFFLGNALLLSGQPDLAAPRLETALALVSDPNIPYDLGLACLERGDSAGAQRWMLSALRLKPDFPEAWATLGDLARRLGRLEEAEARFQRSLALSPGNAGVVRELGLLYVRMGRRPQAVELLSRINQAYPDDAEVAAALRMLKRASAPVRAPGGRSAR